MLKESPGIIDDRKVDQFKGGQACNDRGRIEHAMRIEADTLASDWNREVEPPSLCEHALEFTQRAAATFRIERIAVPSKPHVLNDV